MAVMLCKVIGHGVFCGDRSADEDPVTDLGAVGILLKQRKLITRRHAADRDLDG